MQAGKYQLAQRYYQKIVDYLEYEDKLEGDEQKQRQALMLAAHLNVAMCEIKLGQYHKVKDHCDKALDLDPQNEKAFFRRGTVSSLRHFEWRDGYVWSSSNPFV